MASWYGVAVIPGRARKPRDKAKVEVGCLIAERWIIARLRHRTFYSLGDLNLAIRDLVDWLNRRPFKKLPGSRLSLFEELERPLLRPLPAQRYEFALSKQLRSASTTTSRSTATTIQSPTSWSVRSATSA